MNWSIIRTSYFRQCLIMSQAILSRNWKSQKNVPYGNDRNEENKSILVDLLGYSNSPIVSICFDWRVVSNGVVLYRFPIRGVEQNTCISDSMCSPRLFLRLVFDCNSDCNSGLFAAKTATTERERRATIMQTKPKTLKNKNYRVNALFRRTIIHTL